MPRIEYTTVRAEDDSHLLKIHLISGQFLKGACVCVCVCVCVCERERERERVTGS